jgi:hypothetical protein
LPILLPQGLHALGLFTNGAAQLAQLEHAPLLVVRREV